MGALAALAALAEGPLTPNRGVYIYAPLTQAPLWPRPGAAHHSAQQFSNSTAWVSLHG